MSKKVLMTGGAGFIGHHLAESLLLETDYDIVCVDRLDCSGTIHRLKEVIDSDNGIRGSWKDRVSFVFHDLKAEINSFTAAQIGNVDYILHLAAGSHVDRSIDDPMSFVMDNVVGTTNLRGLGKPDVLAGVQPFRGSTMCECSVSTLGLAPGCRV